MRIIAVALVMLAASLRLAHGQVIEHMPTTCAPAPCAILGEPQPALTDPMPSVWPPTYTDIGTVIVCMPPLVAVGQGQCRRQEAIDLDRAHATCMAHTHPNGMGVLVMDVYGYPNWSFDWEPCDAIFQRWLAAPERQREADLAAVAEARDRQFVEGVAKAQEGGR